MILKTFIDSINCGKNMDVTGNLKINSKANIVDIKPLELKQQSRESAKDEKKVYNAVVFFEYVAEYTVEKKVLGGVKILGRVIYEQGNIDIFEEWAKNKKMPKELIGPILNSVLTRASISALIAANQINLPPPFQLPSVQVKDQNVSYID